METREAVALDHRRPAESDAGTCEISIVVPAFNEAENLPKLVTLLCSHLQPLGTFEIIIVDDGSRDRTIAVLREAAKNDPAVQYLRLSRNFGHQAALRAGLAYARGQAVISMDADLQHPVELVGRMIEQWRMGNAVVTTTRQDPKNLSLFKRATSRAYYKLLNWLSDTKLEPGSADFRLLDRTVVDTINSLPEADLFFRTLIPWLGFQSANIEYVANERLHGTSKYTLRKMTSLAISGIIAHSVMPLRFAMLLAAIVAGLTFAFVVYALFVVFAGGAVPGWASVVVCVNLIGALQFIVLGVIGEYIGRILRETRQRPSYIVAESSLTHASLHSTTSRHSAK